MSMDTDILIVGAGPAGLAFARQFKNSRLRIIMIEKTPLESLQNPAYDGREIALTHRSREIMQHLGMWQHVPENEIYRLRDAKVYNGTSDYTLHFPEPTQARGGKTDRLGNLISNHNIRRAAYEEVAQMNNVELHCGVSVKHVETNDERALVELDNGDTLTAKLLIAADSRLSQTRRQLGIAADMHDFGRTVIVFRTKHSISNQHTASECFFYGRTLALLPLEEHLTNCVITITNTKAHELLDLSPEQLAKEAQKMLNGKLGEMEIAGTVHHYPLMGVHANKFYGKRCALIGDAAVGMHPVTAHGYNLGLESTDILSKQILQADSRGKDIGSSDVLEMYNVKHQMHTRPLYHGTNAMVTFFTTESAPAKLLRNAVLRVSNNLPPLKKLISKQLTG
ncbi:5-demethoxyubiquinol-8 5-hydroxylase UbiM [Kingella kingae]|uniref:5-demethoxyubiquinol-8 5-hydroxylase UbiM n=1 Tax=Kingella kingae TaxID=504 RepID=UPI0018AD30F1|nr:5-demethoxyubiquinol-8 5-hydroxylase UbiM [Kingella kingae]MDK4564558.1 5-demethoxyubiquinol-8 5-hydroxylase UbiM [Kingella kingae]MDK4578805.1 5-demethoxyubiquinol-8 5-hydroxylase UbiM [Kingella kingae]MDK4609106.1 5-demethoxyubiquinol-8 5-hydroxylase UbiM [Kingella kingae]MDK4627066.1 5-demethoxyubiquinol-8 5-hydroxylase UbiM [Kingella kingae]MDK4674798.1 5-demethoxyubiquinol-8 5-hydroxylase UbiM [Kingella kingae]